MQYWTNCREIYFHATNFEPCICVTYSHQENEYEVSRADVRRTGLVAAAAAAAVAGLVAAAAAAAVAAAAVAAVADGSKSK